MSQVLVLVLGFTFLSCARLHRRSEAVPVKLHKVNYGVEPLSSLENWYQEFSCFDEHKSGRVYTTYVSRMAEALGFLYSMESTYDYSLAVYNDQTIVMEERTLVSRPESLVFEVAYCYYQDWRSRFLHFNDPILLYMSVRLK